jgi:AraC-like DNA-binding protein
LTRRSDESSGSASELLAGHPVLRTSDPAQAADALERVLPRIPVRLRTRESRRLKMVMNALDVGSVTASYLRFGTDIHLVTGETESYYVNIPLHGRTLWRNSQLRLLSTPSVAAVLSPGMRGEVVWDGDCAQLCVMVPGARLQRELENHLDRGVAAPLLFEPSMKLDSPTARGWMATLRLIHREIERPGGLLTHPLATRTFENLLIDSLLIAQRHNYTDALSAPGREASSRSARAAIELLEAHPERPWSVGELAREVHLSTRALQQTFARSIGLSPMRYLRQVRLARVHADLLDASPEETTVAEVAARWGFVHHGHFAAAYRTRYGHAPAETLRR